MTYATINLERDGVLATLTLNRPEKMNSLSDQLLAENVVGILRGSDPTLRGTYVAISGHNDHVGYTRRPVDHDSTRAFNRVVRPMGADSPMRTPTPADSFMKYLDKQVDARRAADEAIARAPFWNARFWSYIPMRLESSSIDPTQFFTPSYLTQDYRNAARALEESRKQSLFETSR